jgi:diguanylate cyclase (GGDEF)-like protein
VPIAQAWQADADVLLMIGISLRRLAALIAVPVLVIGCAVFATATIERDSALHSSSQDVAAHGLLTAMLDMETGARGYFETREPSFLAPWFQGQKDFATQLARSRALGAGDAPLQASLDQQAAVIATWRDIVSADIASERGGGPPPTNRAAVTQKAIVDNFRALNSLYETQLTTRRDGSLTGATWLAVGLAAALSIVLVLSGLLLMHRANRRETRRLRRQQELRELLQVSVSEKESQALLIRHVEQLVPGSAAAVFNRNNSDDRLDPQLSEHAAQTPLQGISTEQLKPRSCMAVRLSRSYARSPAEDPLQRCDVCGKIAADVVCEPLLVGGQVIGSVLLTNGSPISRADRDRVRNAVVQAAPILANQRNLAVAELRAASDSLTGLPNRRAADETIKRMAAHAGRTLSPLAVILLDLDHFKHVNDIHGHDQGDKALAAIGQVLTGTLRGSDFAARYGGEEFLALLPDTDRTGAFEVAEKLRRAIERTDISGVGSVTASLGIAVLPDDAAEPEFLLRKADRALYAAKARGRNRVELAATADQQALDGNGDGGGGSRGDRPLGGGELET